MASNYYDERDYNNYPWRDGGRPDNIRNYRQIIVLAFKGAKLEDVRSCFEQFGKIVHFRQTSGNVKGHGITYSKTSEACRAIEEMHGRLMEGYPKPVKVILSVPRDEITNRNDGNAEHLRKIEVILPNHFTTVDQVKEVFSQWGDIEYVVIIGPGGKKKASIKFYRQLHAAIAAENCDKDVFRPRFVIPIEEAKNQKKQMEENRHPGDEVGTYPDEGICTIDIAVPSSVPAHGVEQLCALVPNLVHVESDPATGLYRASYDYPQCASFALDRLNGLMLDYNEPVRARFHDPSRDNRMKISSVSQQLQRSMEVANATGNLNVLAQSMKMAAEMLEKGQGGSGGAVSALSSILGQGDAQAGGNWPAPTPRSSQPSKQNQMPDDAGSYCSIQLPPRIGQHVPDATPESHAWVQCKKQFNNNILLDMGLRFGDVVFASFIKSNSYGFIRFTDATAAENFIAAVNGCLVYGQPFQAQPAQGRKRDDDGPPSKVAKVQ